MTFSGTVTSDYLKYIPEDLREKEKLIDYSAADFNTIREALINYAKATYPIDYNNFSESDFGTLLIEMMAAVGHINSIKADYLANENFLRTAKDRKSVKKLLELIGIRMRGPISAASNARLTLQTTESLPSPSSVTISAENRTFTITSPEDNAPLSYTIYKLQPNGTVDLDSTTTDLVFSVTAQDGVVIITDAVIMEGALVIETGQFASPEVVKSIELTQAPYVERSAQVFIEGSVATNGVYKEEENVYFASGSDDKIFEIATDENFRATILFGDSTIGLSPAIGDTYTVTYRVGGGSRGNIAEEIINVPVTVSISNGLTTESVDAVLENTSIATGGADAETVEHAKRYAPLIFRRQDRLVTLADYKSFVNSFISSYGSTGKANAVVRRAYSSANIIDLFVLEKASNLQLRRATPEYKIQLLQAIEEKKMLTDEPVVVDGLIRTLDLIVSVTFDEKYRKFESSLVSKVKNKILEYFNVDNMEFGEPFIAQDLIKWLLSIIEVRYAFVENTPDAIKSNFNEIIQLNNLTINSKFI